MRNQEGKSLKGWLDLINTRITWLERMSVRIKSRRDKGWWGEVYEAIINHHLKIAAIAGAASTPNCRIKCGSICCYFKPDKMTVPIELQLLDAIKDLLRKGGRNPDGYLQKVDWSLIPKHERINHNKETLVFREGGTEKYWQVKTSMRPIPPRLAKNLPHMFNGKRMWVEGDAKACAFLTDSELCILHESGLKSHTCSGYVCATCSAISIVRQFGYIKDEDLRGLEIADLNRLTDGLLSVFDGRELLALEMDYHQSILRLTDAYIMGEDTTAVYSDFIAQEKIYLARRERMFRRVINPGLLDFLSQLLS
jgi:hypothetical protein